MESRLSFTGIDHVVLPVKEVETSCRFYERIGAVVETFDGNRKAVYFGKQKINLHPSPPGDIYPLAENPQQGSGDFCVLVRDPISSVQSICEAAEIPVIEGPVTRTGAAGQIESVYVRDPDGNLVEIGTYETNH